MYLTREEEAILKREEGEGIRRWKEGIDGVITKKEGIDDSTRIIKLIQGLLFAA